MVIGEYVPGATVDSLDDIVAILISSPAYSLPRPTSSVSSCASILAATSLGIVRAVSYTHLTLPTKA